MLLCAKCGCGLTDDLYYGTCAFVPYCSQQHGHQDQQRHDCKFLATLMELMMPRLEEAGLNVHTVGSAFRGHIPDLIALMRVCPNEVKVFLTACFPVFAHSEMRVHFNKAYAADSLLRFFHSLCE